MLHFFGFGSETAGDAAASPDAGFRDRLCYTATLLLSLLPARSPVPVSGPSWRDFAVAANGSRYHKPPLAPR